MASADAVEINGIYYNLDEDAKTAEVTYLEKWKASYSGTVVIPDKVTYTDNTYSVTAIGDRAFYDCKELIWLTIPGSVTSIGESAFEKCSGLTYLDIPNSVTSIGEEAFYYCSGLTSVTLPSSVTSIGRWAFNHCSGLNSVTILCSPTDYNPDYSYFSNCDNLKEAVFDCETVTNLFAHNTSLEKLTLTESVKSIEKYAFYGCSGLTSVTLPSSVTSIGSSPFSSCSGLTSVTIQCSPTDIEFSPFYECDNLKEAVFDCNTVTAIFMNHSSVEKVTMTEKVTSIDEYAFSGCKALTLVDIPNSVTSIDLYAFQYCSKLTSIDIPNGVTSIGNNAFYQCSGLKSATIGDGVKSIGEYAFYGCSSLTNLSIGKSVKEIGNYAFSNCYFKDVYCYAETIPNTGDYIFYRSYTNNATLHVHRASINVYKFFEPWKSFKEIVTIEAPEKCATPEIAYENGELTLSCETEEVEYVTKITCADKDKFNTDKINLTGTYIVSIYAKKEYYLDSDVATMEIRLPGIDKSDIFGDLNSDDKVDANDAVKLVDIIMGK